MKVVKFFTIALMSSFVLVSGVFAKDIDNVNADLKAAENSVREQLASVLSNVSTEETETVNVFFEASATGFKVSAVISRNEDLAAEVKSILVSRSISVPATLNGKYVIKVRFINPSSL